MARFDLQPAYILHQRAYRNTSLLLEVFSRDQGRFGLVARGARRGANAALLQPFLPLRLSWSLRADLGTFIAAETLQRSWILTGKTTICGFYLNELLTRLCHRHDPHPDVFLAYEQALAELAVEQVETGLRRFEMRLLGALGYGLQLECDADNGQALAAQTTYRYVPEIGPVDAANRAMASTPGIEVSGHSLLALAAGDLDDPKVLSDARLLLRACLNPLLGDRPLRSREIYASMLKLEKAHGGR